MFRGRARPLVLYGGVFFDGELVAVKEIEDFRLGCAVGKEEAVGKGEVFALMGEGAGKQSMRWPPWVGVSSLSKQSKRPPLMRGVRWKSWRRAR